MTSISSQPHLILKRRQASCLSRFSHRLELSSIVQWCQFSGKSYESTRMMMSLGNSSPSFAPLWRMPPKEPSLPWKLGKRLNRQGMANPKNAEGEQVATYAKCKTPASPPKEEEGRSE